MKRTFRTLLYVALFWIATIPYTYTQTENGTIRFQYEYQSILLDSTYNTVDLTVQNYIEQLRERMNKELSTVIGEADQEMRSFKPQSPLSNFLTDILFDFGNQYLAKTHPGTRANLSVLNFGGIRSSLLAGPITIEDIYKVTPFDNKVVIIDIKGEQLIEFFNRFTEKDHAAFSQTQTIYRNGRITQVTIQGEKIQEDKTYKVITIDFLATGGDGFFKDIRFENIIYTDILLRDTFIAQIQQLTQLGKKISGQRDQRVIIQPTP